MSAQPAVEKVKGSIDALPEKGKVAVLRHLLESLQGANIAGCSTQAYKDLLATLPQPTALPLATATTTVDKAAVKQAFMEKYGIQVLGESQVALSLPAGTSRIEFLQAAQELAKSLHGQNAIYDSRLNSWAADKAFTSKGEKALQIAADANVQGSTKHTRSQMVEKKWLDLGIEDLAVAHAAYFIATGKDAFAGNVVRARGGALYFDSDGLDVDYYCDDGGYYNVSASRALPFPNSKT